MGLAFLLCAKAQIQASTNERTHTHTPRADPHRTKRKLPLLGSSNAMQAAKKEEGLTTQNNKRNHQHRVLLLVKLFGSILLITTTHTTTTTTTSSRLDLPVFVVVFVAVGVATAAGEAAAIVAVNNQKRNTNNKINIFRRQSLPTFESLVDRHRLSSTSLLASAPSSSSSSSSDADNKNNGNNNNNKMKGMFTTAAQLQSRKDTQEPPVDISSSVATSDPTRPTSAAAMAASGLASAAAAAAGAAAASASSASSTTPTAAAPMFITIGPQCCGKSTWINQENYQLEVDQQSAASYLSKKAAESSTPQIVDVCLDDQPGVYVKVDTYVWLSAACLSETTKQTNGDGSRAECFLSKQLYGKTLFERIRDDNNIELTLILQRLRYDIDQSEFVRRLTSYYQQKHQQHQQRNRPGPTTTSTIDYLSHCQTLIKVVEDFLVDFLCSNAPETVDLFVLEALFQPAEGPSPSRNGNSDKINSSNNDKMSAIDRAHERLRSVPSHVPVAWGNTNSKPRDYQVALDIASQTNRPVEFVLCHPSNTHNKKSYGDGMTKAIPWVSLDELLRRNLQRLVETGRYIPSFAIEDCRQRVASIIPVDDKHNSNNNDYHNGNNGNGVDRRRILVSQASSRCHEYIMKDNGLIEKRLLRQGQGWNRGGRNGGRGRNGGHGGNGGRNGGRIGGGRNGSAGSPNNRARKVNGNGNGNLSGYYRSNIGNSSSPGHGGGGRGGRGERSRGTTYVGQSEIGGDGGGGHRYYGSRNHDEHGGRGGRDNRNGRGNRNPGNTTESGGPSSIFRR